MLLEAPPSDQSTALHTRSTDLLCTLFIFRYVIRDDARLACTLSFIQGAGVTLNTEKCLFSQTSISFLGHIIDRNGVTANPSKTAAIVQMNNLTNTTELRWFLGMKNQLGEFSPNLAEISQPLHDLLIKHRCWTRAPAQETSKKRWPNHQYVV